MKIAFRTEMGNRIGWGHITRCIVVAVELKSLGWDCVFFTNPDKAGIQYIESHGFLSISIPDYPLDRELNYLKESLKDFDTVYFDSYNISSEYIAAFRNNGMLTICYDDNALYSYDCDVIINANLHADSLNYGIQGKLPIMLLGGEHALFRKEFRDTPAIKVRENAKKIFVCMGGSDARTMTPQIVNLISGIPGIGINAVFGAGTSYNPNMLINKADNINIIIDPPQISKVMNQCDIAVVSSGSIVYEIAALGIPALTIVQADNQRQLANYLSEHGLMECIGDWNNLDKEKLYDSTRKLIYDSNRRANESQALVQTVNKNGAVKVAERIDSVFKEGDFN